ncbi:hypothetical protein ACSTIK_00330, partial [Vibrio parahaemolyticus]
MAIDDIRHPGQQDIADTLQRLREGGGSRVFLDARVLTGLSDARGRNLHHEIDALGNRLVVVVRALKLDSFGVDALP